MSLRLLSRAASSAAAVVLAAASCKDSGPPPIGPPATIALVNTTIPKALANTQLATPINLVVKDANGRAVPNVPVTFAVVAGGGVIASTADTSDASGTVTVPAWTLGKGAETQRVRASVTTVTPTVTLDVDATVETAYKVEVRFYGPAMTPDQQALFMKAAARMGGIVTGDVIDADARGQNIDLATKCNVPGQPPFNELIDDIIIYASIQNIDGPGKILAQAGPCLYRNAGTAAAPQYMPALGQMEFDAADINTLAGSGSLQEVITHEMLHVLGFGILWTDRKLITGSGTPDPRYIGEKGRQGCVAVGGTVTCATSVPLESGGGAGTAESHWRETTFGNELMTGYVNPSPNPLSKMTIGSLVDLGYVTNDLDFDDYTIPGGVFRAAGSTSPSIVGAGWERRSPTTVWVLENGAIRGVKIQ